MDQALFVFILVFAVLAGFCLLTVCSIRLKANQMQMDFLVKEFEKNKKSAKTAQSQQPIEVE
jgi:hypothetical protein